MQDSHHRLYPGGNPPCEAGYSRLNHPPGYLHSLVYGAVCGPLQVLVEVIN